MKQQTHDEHECYCNLLLKGELCDICQGYAKTLDDVTKIIDFEKRSLLAETPNDNDCCREEIDRFARRLSKKIPLKSSCEICGSEENLQKHHWRYDKPLLVNTLCKECMIFSI